MDHWEAGFRQKSSRRANAAAISFHAVVGWAFIAVGFLAFVAAVVSVLNL